MHGKEKLSTYLQMQNLFQGTYDFSVLEGRQYYLSIVYFWNAWWQELGGKSLRIENQAAASLSK